MVTIMIITFVVGYLLITLEHKTHINKAATATILGMILWVMYMFCPETLISTSSAEAFKHFLDTNSDVAKLPLAQQCIKFISAYQVPHFLGDVIQVILYLIAAMSIVELIDVHAGFTCITSRITTRNKTKLLCIVTFLTFFLSAILDNLTTAIVMTMLLRKIVTDKKERWIFASMVILAANSGGAWSPIGDVTTIMLWINENVTTVNLIKYLLLPSIVSVLVPLLIVSFWLGRGDVVKPEQDDLDKYNPYITNLERNIILALGIGGLISIPVFKALTHLPPFMGALLAMGAIWVYVGLMYDSKKYVPESKKYRMMRVIQRIDFGTIFFFLGILLAVSVLQAVGVLASVSQFLDEKVNNIYIINTIIGILSSIVDNVPMVAGAIGMYEMPTQEVINVAQNAEYLKAFMQDGTFWLLLTYCAGVGGSMLIIGSAAGVVVMGLEKITFIWYLKCFSLIAASGYFAGIGMFILQSYLF